MVRLMQTEERAQVGALWGTRCRSARRLLDSQAACEVYVEEQDDVIRAAVMAVPVTLRDKQGYWLHGLCGSIEEPLLAGLVRAACEDQAARGAQFGVVSAAAGEHAALFAGCGFEPAFPLRRVERTVRRNVWSHAEFDVFPPKSLIEMRGRFCADSVLPAPRVLGALLTELYTEGVTIVANEKGYGLYFRVDDTLHFIELMAENDRAAEVLMEAARIKEMIVEKAVLTLGEEQMLYAGEGAPMTQGMIRFEAGRFDVEKSYIGMLL